MGIHYKFARGVGENSLISHMGRKRLATTELPGHFIVTPKPIWLCFDLEQGTQAGFVGCLGLEAALLKSCKHHHQSCLWVGSSHLGVAQDPYRNTHFSQSKYKGRVRTSVLKEHTKNELREQSNHTNTLPFTLHYPKRINEGKNTLGKVRD